MHWPLLGYGRGVWWRGRGCWWGWWYRLTHQSQSFSFNSSFSSCSFTPMVLWTSFGVPGVVGCEVPVDDSEAVPSRRCHTEQCLYQPPQWLWRLAGVLTFSTAHCVGCSYNYCISVHFLKRKSTFGCLYGLFCLFFFHLLPPSCTVHWYTLAISSYFTHVWLLNIKFLSPSKLHSPYRINLSPLSYHS